MHQPKLKAGALLSVLGIALIIALLLGSMLIIFLGIFAGIILIAMYLSMSQMGQGFG